jgi:hypothetical protein
VPDVELGQALDLLGCVRRLTGEASAAAALHEQARGALLRRLKPDHPFVERNALYVALARWDEQRTGANRIVFEDAAKHFATRFDAQSAWTRLIDLQLKRLTSPIARDNDVQMIL